MKTTTHSRAAPASIFASCAYISELPKIEDADWQRSVDKVEQQGQTFTYDFDAEKRDHLEGEIRFAVLLIKEYGLHLNELLQAKDILDNRSVIIVSCNTKSSWATFVNSRRISVWPVLVHMFVDKRIRLVAE